MRSKGVVVAVALVFAVLASTSVAMYVHGVQKHVSSGGDSVQVLVATRDVASGTDANAVVADGTFAMRSVPKSQLVEGAVSDPAEIRGRRTTSPIIAGEQVSTVRFQGSSAQLGGGSLGLPPGYQAISLNLDGARAAGGAIQPGDHVTIYATLSRPAADDVTVTLVADAQVLSTSGRAAGQATSPQMIITVALKPAKAARLVFAQERGSVWLALLAPNESGSAQGPVTYIEATQ